MFRARLALLFVFALVLSGCASQYQPSGSGVSTSILNRAELSEIYVPLSGETPVYQQQEYRVINEDRFVRIADLNLLVHNQGYADSLAALYISGYDPNLFAVEPQGPFMRQGDTRFCYRDLILQDQYEYSVYAICALNEDILVGGGYSREGDTDTIRIDGYDLPVGDLLDSLIDGITKRDTKFFDTYGELFNGLHVSCDITNKREENSREGHCSFTSSFIEFLGRSDARGSLLLALYGEDLAQCQNGCVLVPSPRLPRNFIAGDSPDYPGGELYNVDYSVYLNTDRWPVNYNTHEQLFQVSACYLYTTYATPIVCVDPTPTSSNGDVCRPGVQEISHGQPAPLKITDIDQTNQGPRIMFTIHVQNQLGGTVMHPGAVDFCAPGSPEVYARELRDTAKVIDARVLGELDTLDCRDGIIRMQNGKGQINCFYEIPANAYQTGAYQTALNIEIGYMYRDVQTVQTTIHRI